MIPVAAGDKNANSSAGKWFLEVAEIGHKEGATAKTLLADSCGHMENTGFSVNTRQLLAAHRLETETILLQSKSSALPL